MPGRGKTRASKPVKSRTLRRLRGVLKGTGALQDLMAARAHDCEKEDAASRCR